MTKQFRAHFFCLFLLWIVNTALGRIEAANLGIGSEGSAVMSTNDSYGKYLPRTMALLESATPEHHTLIRILFYGQSIIGSGYADRAIKKYLQEKFPYADVKIQNTAIGGYEAPKLRKTAWADLYPVYPDLVVFHVYGGGQGELEEIYRNLQKYTTAEVLTWTHHVDNLGVDKERDEESNLRTQLAIKYGQEIADVRTAWKAYLTENHKRPEDLLIDHKIHLNPEGGDLLGQLLLPHFKDNLAASSAWKKWVQTFNLNQPVSNIIFDPNSWKKTGNGLASSDSKPFRIEFTGNRVDLVGLPSGAPAGSAQIRLDGQIPSRLVETLAISRTSLAPGAWWPAVDRVTTGSNAVPDKYVMSFHDVAPDGSHFQFDLRSEAAGDEGSGAAGEDFISKSGRIRIHAADIDIAAVRRVLKKDLPPSFAIDWKVYSLSRDVWQAPSALDTSRVYQDTVIQLWDSGNHVLELIPNGDGPVGIQSVMVFNPSARS